MSEMTRQLSQLHELLLQGIACAAADNSAIYLSGPITTGERFVSWYRTQGRLVESVSPSSYIDGLHSHVIAPNIESLKSSANALRATNDRTVIEPSSLTVHGWDQADYYSLWLAVIARFANQIVVLEGWAFSSGCALEVSLGLSSGLPVRTMTGAPVTVESFRREVSQAAQALKAIGNIARINSIAATLETLGSAK